MGRINSLILAVATFSLGCSVIVEDQLNSNTDAGPTGPTCTNTEMCLQMAGRQSDCTQECVGGVCVSGRTTPNGIGCFATGPGQHCVMGNCVDARCGDGYADRTAMPPEFCDDGNTNPDDTCNNMCTRSCVPPATPNCDDGNPCNGMETCGMTLGVCRAGPPAPDGSPCMIGADDGICQRGVCDMP